MLKDFLTTHDAATFLGVKVDRLRHLARLGVVKSIKVCDRGPRLFQNSDLEEYKKSQAESNRAISGAELENR